MRPDILAQRDQYAPSHGRAFLSGSQALVRLPLEQKWLDEAQGRNTAGFISGYRGSPLGTYDSELWKAKPLLETNNIVFSPGVNEDLAATAVWGSQQIGLFPSPARDGVFSIWYGKGPGVDRSGDAIKHANLFGTAEKGGVLMAFGDDHTAKSSTLAHQSEQALIAAMIPVLNPSSVSELLDFGLFGWALSRFSGLWVGLKCVTEVVESSASVDLSSLSRNFTVPDHIVLPPEGLHGRFGHQPVEAERRLHRYKIPLVLQFARANRIDRVVTSGERKTLGIVTAGKAFGDVQRALRDAGLDDPEMGVLGIGVYKVGLTWPLEPVSLKNFALGYDELLFIEEKRGVMEEQAARILFNDPLFSNLRISGKVDPKGANLVPTDGNLDPPLVGRIISRRMAALGLRKSITPTKGETGGEGTEFRLAPNALSRRPYFCSGCPHNRSTKLPEGSQAMAGIGCSYMAVWMDRETVTSVHMGAEGSNWNGIAPFSNMPHIFQNMGDGTYFHSGLLSIRAAVAAGVNITFKILYNDAVAMTGGQPVDGPISVARITRQVRAEGVETIIVVTDPKQGNAPQSEFAPGVELIDRDQLEAVQLRLREVPGTSVLLYDQTCAAEKRRRRKRGEYPDPDVRAYINPDVCEGCGDCSRASNCVSIRPLETPMGRKRLIDQASCNKDYSCTEGFCPSFVTVHGAALKKARPAAPLESEIANLPEPAVVDCEQPYAAVIAGIGGTGVVTVGKILASAAHLDGKIVTTFDMTGLAQKNGAVVTHVQIANEQDVIETSQIARGGASLLLACDLVASCQPEIVALLDSHWTAAIINTDVVPTGDFQQDTDMDLGGGAMLAYLADFLPRESTCLLAAEAVCAAATGSSDLSNLLMLGYASQAGMLPVSPDAIKKAMGMGGRSAATNCLVFDAGRLARHRTAIGVDLSSKSPFADGDQTPVPTLETELERLGGFLSDYQNARYAKEFVDYIGRIAKIEDAAIPESTDFACTVAQSLAKLMAYKDEYEVGRLFARPEFRAGLDEVFEQGGTLRFHMAPPIFGRKDPVSGLSRKSEFGPWMWTALRLLAKLKGLRGSWLDPFGYTHERRLERAMIGAFRNEMEAVAADLSKDNIEPALKLAALPQKIRGYGHVKHASMAQANEEKKTLLCEFSYDRAVDIMPNPTPALGGPNPR